jgi:hypothetical protein
METEVSVLNERKKAALVAAGVGGWLVLGVLIEKVMGLIAYASTSGQLDMDSGAYLWSDVPYRLGTFIVPVTLGLFLAWTFVVRITGAEGLRTAITRSIVAAVLASVFYALVRVVVDVVIATSLDRSVFANSFPQLSYGGAGIPVLLTWSLQSTIAVIVDIVPLAVLGGILLWHWLRRDAPTRESVV